VKTERLGSGNDIASTGEQTITGFAASAEAQVVVAGVVTIPELL